MKWKIQKFIKEKIWGYDKYSALVIQSLKDKGYTDTDLFRIFIMLLDYRVGEFDRVHFTHYHIPWRDLGLWKIRVSSNSSMNRIEIEFIFNGGIMSKKLYLWKKNWVIGRDLKRQ